jgi:hypothetical protein
MAVCADSNFPLNGLLFGSGDIYGAAKDILASSAAKADAN